MRKSRQLICNHTESKRGDGDLDLEMTASLSRARSQSLLSRVRNSGLDCAIPNNLSRQNSFPGRKVREDRSNGERRKMRSDQTSLKGTIAITLLCIFNEDQVKDVRTL